MKANGERLPKPKLKRPYKRASKSLIRRIICECGASAEYPDCCADGEVCIKHRRD